MKRMIAGVALAVAAAAMSGCYYDPGYSYVRSAGGGGAYYGTSVVYSGGYYPGYYYPGYYGYYGCCYAPVTIGIYGGSGYYRHGYYGGGGYWHGHSGGGHGGWGGGHGWSGHGH